MDPNMFIKDEPHPLKKSVTSRWRLNLDSVLYVDSTIHRILHGRQNKVDSLTYLAGYKTPHCIGLGHDDGGQFDFGKVLERLSRNGTVGSADASGWDLSVSADALWMDTRCRVLLAPESVFTSNCISLKATSTPPTSETTETICGSHSGSA